MIRRALRVTLTAAIAAPSLCGIAMAEATNTSVQAQLDEAWQRVDGH
ncbi:MAG TPA: hypothetical protein VFK80_00755 [Limnochordia bacterium]|nr:hypothetical protein [Limnochordia bacterium]